MTDDTPMMGMGMHAAVTLLGTAFGMFGCYLVYGMFSEGFSWKMFFLTAVVFGIAADFLHGAFTRRYPFSALFWFAPP